MYVGSDYGFYRSRTFMFPRSDPSRLNYPYNEPSWIST